MLFGTGGRQTAFSRYYFVILTPGIVPVPGFAGLDRLLGFDHHCLQVIAFNSDYGFDLDYGY